MHFMIAAIVSAESREEALDAAGQIFSQMCGDIYHGARYDYFYMYHMYHEEKEKWPGIEESYRPILDVMRVDREDSKKKAKKWLDYFLTAIS